MATPRSFFTADAKMSKKMAKREEPVKPKTDIINKASYDKEYAHMSGSSLLFEADLWDCVSYVDLKKLRKTLNIKGKILHILLRRNDDPLFRNIANKDIKYENGVFCDSSMDGAYEYPSERMAGMYLTNHPIGDAIVVVP